MKARSDLWNFGLAIVCVWLGLMLVYGAWLMVAWSLWLLPVAALLAFLAIFVPLKVGLDTLWAFWVWHRDYASDKEG